MFFVDLSHIMWKQISKYFWGVKDSSDASMALDEAYNVISQCKDQTPAPERKNEEATVEDIGPYEVCNRIGRVTHIFNDMYRVDDMHDFKTDINNISIGTKISYQLIKEKGDVQVADVHVLENDWDVVHTGKKLWHERTLICTVVDREGRNITLTPGDIQINLNKVCAEFVPIVGDWVELSVKCETDENVIDLNGKIIEVDKLQPLRPQLKLGRVSRWNSYEGVGLMDNNIFFDKDSLYCGYFPVQGDKVVAEIIESNQGNCTWRAIKILPDYIHTAENKIPNGVEYEDIKESHDGLSITDDIRLTFTKMREMKLFMVEVESQEEVQLVCVETPKINGQCSLVDPVDHFTIKANFPLSLKFRCQVNTMGESRELIIFHFENFKIKRWVTISAAPYRSNHKQVNGEKSKQYVTREQREVMRGQRIKASARFASATIPQFDVPERLLNLVTKYWKQPLNKRILMSELEKMKSCLSSALTYMNYEDRFHTLIHLEEISQVLEMQNYDQERAVFVRSGEYLLLEIENLAERRPSVIVGDRVMARSITDPNQPDYEGYIHKIARSHVYIKFSVEFHQSYNGEDYSIFIISGRTTFRREHYAVNLAVKHLGKDWLFPSKITENEPQLEFVFDSYEDAAVESHDGLELPHEQPPHVFDKQRLLDKIRQFHENKGADVPVRKLEWHNKCLNYYQKEAVRNALLGVCRPLPYIIFGPPGTGKTVTIVEAVLQLLRLIPHSRILLCAPSNSAADLLALRLIESGVLKPGDLIRLVAMAAVPSIPSKLAPYCATANIERVGTESSLPVVMPGGLVLGYNSKVLGRHRITVATCSTAGVLHSMGFSKGHFSHIIVDEAGQTTEPSVLIPLSFLDRFSGQAILAGDPMQLGPVISSRLACDYGLEESFLERLSSRFPYVRDSQGFPDTCGYDPRLITKLIYSYRALPTLLKLPSQMFYNDDLKPTVSETDSPEADILRKLQEILPRNKEGKLAPLIFHGVNGDNLQPEDSPSWYNPSEVSQVFYYVNELYRLGLSPSDIGIISPYKAQTRQITELFKEAEFDFPKIGTVEEFQGQEFNVIIISTVRSNTKFIPQDIKHSMGFIANPRRLNVSITRAKSLLIIVGNSELLSAERCWRSVINYCREHGGVLGNI